MRIKILGYGDIGKALHSLFKKCELEIVDPKYKMIDSNNICDYVLVAIPFSDTFLQICLEEKSKCKNIVIFSTVPIGTTKNIPGAVHIPIEGKHPFLDDSLKHWKFFMGYNPGVDMTAYIKLFNHIQKSVYPIESTDTTEAMKILSTTLYGVNIEYARYANDTLKDKYEYFNDYNNAYNYLYAQLGIKDYRRYILYPPEKVIGGHCVKENARFVNGIFPEIVKKTYKGV
jgi:hypothetical protein